jgi:pimeloyl-ACP methyl ester carboxylesterase
VFVHGLASSAMTWLPFLAEAFPASELQVFDFAVFNYQTSLVSRFNPFQRLPRVEEWARVLANTIRTTLVSQERYDSFVLVGHSMGGLVCKFAIRYLLEDDTATTRRLHSLFTYGTPNYGSERAGFIGSLFSPDLAFLRAFGASIHDLQTFWNSRISAVPETEGKLTVHERAVMSAKDYLVSPVSSIGGLPEKFILRLASNHTALTVPAGPGDPRLAWFIEQLRAIGRQSECSLLEIRNGPNAEMFAAALQGEQGVTQLLLALFQIIFVLDIGNLDGVAKEDRFALYYESTEIRDHHGRIIDRISGQANLLTAIEVRERATYCKLTGFSYGAALENFQRSIDKLQKEDDEQLDDAQLGELVFSIFGRRAKRIPRHESDAAKAMENIKERINNEQPKSRTRDNALLELLEAARDFVKNCPGSILADGAAFNEAWSMKELGRYEEAEKLFERFLENYPFSTAATGAREWIEEIQYRVRLRDSHEAPEQQLELAEYLLAKEQDIDDAVALAFEAYCRMPALLTRMKSSVRFMLACRYALHESLGMDLQAPEAMAALLKQYKADPNLRQQTRVAIEAKAAPDRAQILLQLLDAASADWKQPTSEA